MLQPEAIAIYQQDIKLTFAQLNERVNVVTEQLKKQGVSRKSIVAAKLENRWQSIVLIFACLKLCAVVCPISHYWPSEQQARSLEDIGASFAFNLENVDAQQFIQHLAIDFDIADSDATAQSELEIDNSLPFTAIFTSGSKGHPKAVLHSFEQHQYSALGSQSVLPLAKNNCWLLSLPIFHIGGLAILFRCFINGASLAICQPNEWQQGVMQFPVSHLSLVPTQLIRCFNEDSTKIIKKLTQLTAVLLGGAFVSDSLRANIKAHKIMAFESYGLTEMASQVFTHAISNKGFNSCLPYRKYAVASDGELLLRGKTLALGYLVNGQCQPFNRQSWFKSKDLVEQGPQGIKIIGRKDNMFVCGGENIQPETIEQVILASGYVEQVVVVAVKDLELGHRPVAFVQWSAEVNKEKLTHYLQQSLMAIALPVAYWPLPKPSVGQVKISRLQLEKLAEQLKMEDKN